MAIIINLHEYKGLIPFNRMTLLRATKDQFWDEIFHRCCNYHKMSTPNVGYFGHGRFGHGHFGQDISAIKNAKGGRFGQNHRFIYFCVYMGGLMLMCAGCMYMGLHACMQVHACAMAYFDLAVYMFIFVYKKHQTMKFVLVG